VGGRTLLGGGLRASSRRARAPGPPQASGTSGIPNAARGIPRQPPRAPPPGRVIARALCTVADGTSQKIIT